MADRELEFTAHVASGVAAIDDDRWNALAGSGDPFLTHGFLSALEELGSIGPGTGWHPAPIMVEIGGELVAAAPAYLKTHSQGEYVFDHGWAEALERAGGNYYPKLLVAVPFTPVPGRRLLGAQPQGLLTALESVTRQNQFSSAHITFIDPEGASEAERRGWLTRHGIQYHWFNRGYGNFADFLGALSSRKRKAIRKERETARQGLVIETLRGAEIGPEDWDAMWDFYQETGMRKWGRPYLTRAFFDLIAERLGDQLLLFLARRDGIPIAGALNFVGDKALYGRYWGCLEEVPFLHFELSYYRAIEWAIAHGLERVEAGAQGEHKLARGYQPVITRSVHWISDPGFRSAIADFVEREKQAIKQEMAWFATSLPYKAGSFSP